MDTSKIKVTACAATIDGVEFDSGKALDFLAERLTLMGVRTAVEHAQGGRFVLSIDVPRSTYDAEISRTRGAGRRRRHIHIPDDSPLPFTCTAGEFMTWREQHGADECAAALGLSRASYFRKLPAIKEADPRTFMIDIK